MYNISELNYLLENNLEWAAKTLKENPDFFKKLSKQQSPKYLWIGCSDSRVPANEIVGLPPGEVFVHRNIANVVVHSDMNCLSVIQYAVEVLKIKHIIVCGHYGCGGVEASMDDDNHGMMDNWLEHIRTVSAFHQLELNKIKDKKKKFDRLCELNVVEQVANVYNTSVVKKALKDKQELHIHGWIYSIYDGILRDLNVTHK